VQITQEIESFDLVKEGNILESR